MGYRKSRSTQVALIGIAAAVTVSLTSCGLLSNNSQTVIDCIPLCRFEIPTSISDSLVSYDEFLNEVAEGNYLAVENMAGIETAYRNIYSVSAYNGGLMISVYDVNSAIDLSTITTDNVKDMIIDLLGETTILLEDGTYWGIDTTTDFYKNIAYDMDEAILTNEKGAQRLQIPLTSYNTYQIYEDEKQDGFTTGQSNYEGYVVFLTPEGKSTKLFIDATYTDNDLVDIHSIADSFVYDASVKGSDTAFTIEVIESIQERLEAIAPTLE